MSQVNQVNLVESLRRIGFQGMDEEAGVTLAYIGLQSQMNIEDLKIFTRDQLRWAKIDVADQIKSGSIELTPSMISSLIGLAILNDSEPLGEVLAGLKTAALQSAAEETAFFED